MVHAVDDGKYLGKQGFVAGAVAVVGAHCRHQRVAVFAHIGLQAAQVVTTLRQAGDGLRQVGGTLQGQGVVQRQAGGFEGRTQGQIKSGHRGLSKRLNRDSGSAQAKHTPVYGGSWA